MTRFRKLAFASLIATFVLVGIGGLVRATKSGLGCGDNWPHCPGDIDRALLIESSHRAAAGAVIFLIGLMLVTAWKHRLKAPKLFSLSVAAFGLVLAQALIGAVVVWLELRAESVLLHLSAAMSLVALLIYIVITSAEESGSRLGPQDPRISRRTAFAAGAVLMLMLVGSYVTGRGAGYVFADWPLMDGRLVPDLGNELFAIHFLHRALAGIVGVIVAIICIDVIRRRDEFPLQARLASAALALYLLEVGIGALNVFTELNAAAVTAHLALSSLIWGSLVAAAVVSRTVPRRVPAPARRPAFEGADR
jgi:heme a synthase